MGKIAFVFAGQGAQYPGMGKDLGEASPAAAELFRQADALRPETTRQCFSGTEEELRETKITQPCMFAVELAAAAALTEAGIAADVTAGFSLGELAALTYAGAMDFAAGFQLVSLRGQVMQEASEEVPTAMAAVLKLDNEAVEGVCARFDQVYPVNYNCPGQVTVAGLASQMEGFAAAVKEAGGRAIPLKVSGAFHTPFMASASEKFSKALAEADVQDAKVATYANCTGLPYESGKVKELLDQQMCSPVRWEAIVRHMIAQGVDTFVELGPGKTLSGFIGKIDKDVRTFHVSDAASLRETIEGVKAC